MAAGFSMITCGEVCYSMITCGGGVEVWLGSMCEEFSYD
jgi:hypothetical protein